MRRTSYLRVFVFAATLILTGCQTLPWGSERDADGDWLRDASYFNGQGELSESWRYSAKIGLKIDEQREQANMVWQHHQQANNIKLFGPLGAGAVRIEFDQNGVVLTDNKGEKHTGESASNLLKEITGWSIPVNALSFWLFAQPAPEAVFDYQLNEDNQLAVLRQLGWIVSFNDWRDYQGKLLPRKMVAEKSFGEAEVVVRLITKSWKWD